MHILTRLISRKDEMLDQPDDLTRLRKAHYILGDLPETITFPQQPGRDTGGLMPVAEATIDDIAFAIIAAEQESSAAYRPRCSSPAPLQARPQGGRHWDRPRRCRGPQAGGPVMALPIISADERLAQRKGIKGCIFGRSGIGKTSLLWTLNATTTLFMDLEAGDLAVEGWNGDTLRPRTWKECRDFAVFIGGPNPALRDDQPYSQAHFDEVCSRYGDSAVIEKYETIFIDSITVAGRPSMRSSRIRTSAWRRSGCRAAPRPVLARGSSGDPLMPPRASAGPASFCRRWFWMSAHRRSPARRTATWSRLRARASRSSVSR